MSAVEEQGAASAAKPEPAGNVGTEIVEHVLDSGRVPGSDNSWHLGNLHIPLPEVQLFGETFLITKHMVMMVIVALILIVTMTRIARRAREPVPRGLRNLVEVFILFIRDEIARKSIPHHADRYVGYLLSTFFFILTCNLMGLVPGMTTATGNISVTAGLALIAFVQIQWGGIREFGFFKHFSHLAPPGLPLWLIPLMVVVEFLSMLVRPFALCIRLFANMMAGHVVILAFIYLIFILQTVWVAPMAVGFALFIHLLEIIIAIIQAYIFTVLTATFIGMSIHPAH